VKDPNHEYGVVLGHAVEERVFPTHEPAIRGQFEVKATELWLARKGRESKRRARRRTVAFARGPIGGACSDRYQACLPWPPWSGESPASLRLGVELREQAFERVVLRDAATFALFERLPERRLPCVVTAFEQLERRGDDLGVRRAEVP
jgi:hypothetical protein